jgi:hemoglobin
LLTSLADLGVAKEAVTAVGERLEGARAEVVTA